MAEEVEERRQAEQGWPENEIELIKDKYTIDREGGRGASKYARSLFKEVNLAFFTDIQDEAIYLEYQTMVNLAASWNNRDLKDYWSSEQQAFVLSTRARRGETAKLLQSHISISSQSVSQDQPKSGFRRLLPGGGTEEG